MVHFTTSGKEEPPALRIAPMFFITCEEGVGVLLSELMALRYASKKPATGEAAVLRVVGRSAWRIQARVHIV